MLGRVNADADAPLRLRAHAYSPLLRVVVAVLVALSRASLLGILAMGLTSAMPVPLAAWVRVLIAFAVAPALVAAVLERMQAMDVEVHDTELVLEQRGLRLEVPCSAIERVTPWLIPLPGAGFVVWLRSGRRLRYGVEAADPSPILSALAEVSGVEAAGPAMRHPSIAYAQVKERLGRWHWYHYLIKFVLFPLAPTAIWFNLNQHVMFGGLLGQYNLQGLGPYVKTFAIHWGLVIVYLALYASVWRGLAECAALLTAWVAPARAATVRWVGELSCRLLYYIGVPIIVLLPFLQ